MDVHDMKEIWLGCMNEMDGHGKQILKGNQKKLASLCHHSPPPAQDMIWDEIWSDLALWDGDFGGSYFNTKLFLFFFQSHLPPPLVTHKQ
ncbi:hypothetical protein VNO78_17022 [Psophocarpus tetragonolobus]|uniref:Uncharacterized protein n=1 Tax=Psophocarpus tetragonolobus TaxID=3891 RepID=A0AAN9XKH3_PSOTE